MCWFKKKKKEEPKVNKYHNKGTMEMRFENTLLDLFEEFGFQELQVGYRMSGSTLYIYTNKPGMLIGPRGKNVERMKEVIFQEFGFLKEIEFWPIVNILPTRKWTEEEIREQEELMMKAFMEDLI